MKIRLVFISVQGYRSNLDLLCAFRFQTHALLSAYEYVFVMIVLPCIGIGGYYFGFAHHVWDVCLRISLSDS